MSPEMWLIALGCLVGFFVGGLLGVWIMCMMVSAGRADRSRGR